MASTQTLVDLVKAELRQAGISYADLAQELALSESSVKRMFAAGGEMPLSRLDEICRVLKTDFAELAAKLAGHGGPERELTLEQERAVVADARLLLAAICCQSQWSFEQILAHYRFSEAELTALLVQLDHLGIITLKPLNRYKLEISKTLRWRPQGPVMAFFREAVVQDFFSGSFDDDGELLTLVHGQLSPANARELRERLARVVDDFARMHPAALKLPEGEKRSYTLIVGMRSWLFERFRPLQR